MARTNKKPKTLKKPIKRDVIPRTSTFPVWASFPVTSIMLLALMGYQNNKSQVSEKSPSILITIIYWMLAAVSAMLTQVTVLTPYKTKRFIVLVLTSLSFIALLVFWVNCFW